MYALSKHKRAWGNQVGSVELVQFVAGNPKPSKKLSVPKTTIPVS
jgi:hypothetical protein